MKEIKRRLIEEIQIIKNQEPPLCKCGCMEKVKWNKCWRNWNTYLPGHHSKGKKLTKEQRRNQSIGKGGTGILKEEIKPKLCACGCGEYTKPGNTFIYGHRNKGDLHPLTGRKQTDEHNRNISLGNKGKKRSKEHCKNTSKGMKKYFEDPEALIRASCAQQCIKREDWKGFISQEPYCDVWTKEYKDFIKERDEWKCLNPKCRKTSKTICAHHIDYNKKNCEPWNIITVCMSCNGRANGNRKYWQKFYTNIMKEKYNYGR